MEESKRPPGFKCFKITYTSISFPNIDVNDMDLLPTNVQRRTTIKMGTAGETIGGRARRRDIDSGNSKDFHDGDHHIRMDTRGLLKFTET